MKARIINYGLLFLVLSIISISFAAAVAVTAPYWEGFPLIVNPGDVKNVALELQNMAGDGDITLRAELVSGSEIAKMTDKSHDYLIPLGRNDIKVNLQIKIPENASLGQKWGVGVSFKTVTSGGSEGVAMGIGIQKSFEVIVGPPQEKPKEKANVAWIWAGAVVIVIVLLVILLLLSRRKKKRR